MQLSLQASAFLTIFAVSSTDQALLFVMLLQVTQLFIGYVGRMLQQYGQNPDQNWKAKDCAIYLVLALTVRGKTAAQGATTTNQLVNLLDFFNQHILPELQSSQIDQRPVIKADALKYLTLFRSQIPKDVCVQVCLLSC